MNFFLTKTKDNEGIDLDRIRSTETGLDRDEFLIRFKTGDTNGRLSYKNMQDRDSDYLGIVKLLKNKNQGGVMFGLDEYVKENRRTLWTIVLVAFIDHFFLDGSLKKTIEDYLKKILKISHEK